MGRLYWKFFLFFFFAQLTAVLVVSLAIGLVQDQRDRERRLIDLAPPAKTMVLSAMSVLKLGGIDSLKQLLQELALEPIPQLYAVNEYGIDLLQRNLPKGVNKQTLSKLNNQTNGKAIQQIQADDGHIYWLFVEPKPHKSKQHAVNKSLFGQPFPPKSSVGGIFAFKHFFPLMPLIAGILVSFIFAAMLAWYFSRPIKQLRLAFDQAANGDLAARVGNAMQGRRDELADLGNAFDVMVGRIGQLVQGQTHLMHQVSHELRSPLARLQIAIGLLKQQSGQSDTAHFVSEKMTTSLNRIETESVRMDHLVGELLTLSRLESGMMALQKEPIDLDDVLQEIVADANFEGSAKRVGVEYVSGTKMMISAQVDLLQRAIDNVLRNAVKYSPAGATVAVEALQLAAKLNITISDKGAGVSEAELESIFKPFYRAAIETASTPAPAGYGLGLAIAKQIIEAHAGQISAHNHLAGGFTVTITLPTL